MNAVGAAYDTQPQQTLADLKPDLTLAEYRARLLQDLNISAVESTVCVALQLVRTFGLQHDPNQEAKASRGVAWSIAHHLLH